MKAMSSRMTSGMGSNRWPVWTMISIACWVLPKSAMLASPEAASWPRWNAPRLAVGLHRRDDLLRHLLQIRHLIETDHIPNLDEPLGFAAHMPEQVRDRRRTGHEGRVGRNLLNHIAFAGAAGAELDKVEIALAERNEAGQEQQFEPLGVPLSFTLKSIQQMMGRPTPITWNHRVLLIEEHGEKSYCIHEVHYDEDGSVMGWTQNATPARSSPLRALRVRVISVGIEQLLAVDLVIGDCFLTV